jgi:hypothetical protein
MKARIHRNRMHLLESQESRLKMTNIDEYVEHDASDCLAVAGRLESDVIWDLWENAGTSRGARGDTVAGRFPKEQTHD